MDQLFPYLVPTLAILAAGGFLIYTAQRIGIRFLIRRLAGLVFVMLGVSFITFIMGYLAPGDAVRTLCGQHCTNERYLHLLNFYGLDLPWYTQYLRYLGNLLHGNLGYSFLDDNTPVLVSLGRFLP